MNDELGLKGTTLGDRRRLSALNRRKRVKYDDVCTDRSVTGRCNTAAVELTGLYDRSTACNLRTSYRYDVTYA